jgi:hypothetical protein
MAVERNPDGTVLGYFDQHKDKPAPTKFGKEPMPAKNVVPPGPGAAAYAAEQQQTQERE